MWLVGIGAAATFPVSLIISIVAFKPDCLTITLECKDMGGDTVEEPAVMRNHDRTTRKVQQCFFQCA